MTNLDVKAGVPQQAVREVLEKASRPQECDLIFKGGVTSGVVYPRAIEAFARTVRLRAIGGTSAGAIAAGAAAAAEFGARHHPDQRGDIFARVGAIPEELGRAQGSSTRMLGLFQPSRPMRALYRWCLAGLSEGPARTLPVVGRLVWATWCRFPLWSLVGAVVAALLFTAMAPLMGSSLWSGAPPGAWGLLMLAILVGGLLGGLTGVGYAFLCVLPNENYGMCSGNRDVSKAPKHPGRRDAKRQGDSTTPDDDAPLTVWLHETLQLLAGGGDRRKEPLTFGDLWNAPAGADAASGVTRQSREASDPDPVTRERAIDLRVMTTCVSQGRPYTFPLPEDETTSLYFREEDMRRLFPPDVVEHLVRHARHPAGEDEASGRAGQAEGDAADDELLRLPAMENLPILVPLRMSLSFPLLLEAVPLYTRAEKRVPAADARCPDREGSAGDTGSSSATFRRVWFSDGGLCSNFPVHLFDGPLPTRPTFAINLGDDLNVRHLDPAAAPPACFVRVPGRNGEGKEERVLEPRPGKPAGLAWFLGALLDTSRNWNDHTQLRTPGFRDRVAQVSLLKDEGGMNLRMTGVQIERLARRGQAAAELLIERFFPDEEGYEHRTTWQNHVWVRHRTGMLLLEERLEALLAAVEHHHPLQTSIEHLHEKPPSFPWKSRPRTDDGLAALTIVCEAAERLRARREEAGLETNGGTGWLMDREESKAPRPRPQLRVRPEV